MAHLAQILPWNTLVYSSYICHNLRLYVKVKIVFEAHKDATQTFFLDFHIFCPVTWSGKSHKFQIILHIISICNPRLWKN